MMWLSYLVWPLLTEPAISNIVANLVVDAGHAETTEEASRLEAKAARLLSVKKAAIAPFCKRFFDEFRDEQELANALSVAARIRVPSIVIAESALSVACNERVEVHYQRGAIGVVGQHASAFDQRRIPAILRCLDPSLSVSFATALIMNLDRFHENRRFGVLYATLSCSNVVDHDVRRHFLGSVIGGATSNEALYVQAIATIPELHFRALLMIGLIEEHRKKHSTLEDAVMDLAMQNRMAAWYYDKYREIYRDSPNVRP